MKAVWFHALAGLALLSVVCRTNALSINDTLSEWNLVTYQDLTHIGDYQGRAYVGGNVTMANSFDVAQGTHLSAGDVGLAVAGSIVSGNPVNVDHGSVMVGGSKSSSNPRSFNLNSHGSVSYNNSAWFAANSPLTQISQNSKYWSTLAANGTVTAPVKNQNGPVTFTAPQNAKVAVFNVTDAQTFEQNGAQTFNLVLSPLTTTVIINVNSLDGVVNWMNGNFGSSFQQAAAEGIVLFNFYNATKINLAGQFDGYLMAPKADVFGNNDIDGGVVARDLSIGEVHLPNSGSGESSWNGHLPDYSVPEVPTPYLFPATVLALVCGRRLLKR